MSWGNWNFGGSTTRQQAANNFLNSGNINTAFGGTACRGSQDCASGYACVGGRCVQKSSQQSSTGGTCGEGTGGGGCGGNSVSLYNSSGELVASGDVVSRQGTASGVVYKSYAWTPTYSDDGCTVTGCSLAECGGGLDSDCPQGQRSCRYDAFGTVNCFCGPPVYTGCSTFCTAYSASNGSDATGCSGLSCDECSYCDEVFVSASGVCRPLQSGSPCHCRNEPIPDCHRCDENGTVVPDSSSCQECVTISNYECDSCGDGQTITKTCCQPLGTDGLTLTNKCQDLLEQDCQSLCPPGEPGGAPTGNCDGDCEPKTICQPGSCPDLPPNAPGHRNTASGCIEAGGQGCLLYYDCDVSGLPPECALCDCNCNNDCPNCYLCGADGKCYPDPSCNCDGNYCPGAPGDCCPNNGTCYQPDPLSAGTRACCDEGRYIVDIYLNTFQTDDCGGTNTYTTWGPPAVTSGSCITCTGNSATCGTYCARPTMRITNLWNGSVVYSADLAFQDEVAPTCCSVSGGWCGIGFPILLSSVVSQRLCVADPNP
jgi:hypothetical protein